MKIKALCLQLNSGNLASVSHGSDTIFNYTYNSCHGLITNSNASLTAAIRCFSLCWMKIELTIVLIVMPIRSGLCVQT